MASGDSWSGVAVPPDVLAHQNQGRALAEWVEKCALDARAKQHVGSLRPDPLACKQAGSVGALAPLQNIPQVRGVARHKIQGLEPPVAPNVHQADQAYMLRMDKIDQILDGPGCRRLPDDAFQSAGRKRAATGGLRLPGERIRWFLTAICHDQHSG